MSQPLLRALGATTAIVVVTSLLGQAPVEARESDPAPRTIAVTAKANGPDHFNSSIKVDLPPGGTAKVTSPTLNNTMTKAKVDVSDLSDDPEFDQIAIHLAQLPTPGKRIIACLTAALEAVDLTADSDALSQADATAGEISIVVIFFCLLIASIVADRQAGLSKTAAPAPGCAISPLQIKTTTEKTDAGYTMSATPNISLDKKKSEIKVKCKRVGNKRIYTIKPRKKGKTLRSVVGKNLVVGLASPSNASQTCPLRVSFKAP